GERFALFTPPAAEDYGCPALHEQLGGGASDTRRRSRDQNDCVRKMAHDVTHSLRLRALDQRGGGRALERQAISDLAHQPLLDRLHEVDARVAARNLRLAEQALCDL